MIVAVSFQSTSSNEGRSLISDDTFVDICENIDLCVKDSISGLAIGEMIGGRGKSYQHSVL